MKKNLFIIFLATILIGCNSVDGRLVLADSLLDSHPDSSLLILNSVKNLSDERNKAYFALLHSIASCKNNFKFTTDSLINIAVDYYQNEDDRDKLSRAYLYKGVAMSDLGLLSSAMEHYKKAEYYADTNNYLHTGLINVRIGELYESNLASREEFLNRYKKALSLFERVDHKPFTNRVLWSIGLIYMPINVDSSSWYLNKSYELAKMRKDSVAIDFTKSLQIKLHMQLGQHLLVRDMSLGLINSKWLVHKERLYGCLIDSYINLNKYDSAEYYLDNHPTMQGAHDSIRYYKLKSKFSLTRKDYKSAYDYYHRLSDIRDSLIFNSAKSEFYKIEKIFDSQKIKDRADKLNYQVTMQAYFIMMVVILGVVFLVLGWLFIKRRRLVWREKANLFEQIKYEAKYREQELQNALNDNALKISKLNKSLEEKGRIAEMYKLNLDERFKTLKKLIVLKYQFEGNPDRFFKEFQQIVAFSMKSEKQSESFVDLVNMLNSDIIDKSEMIFSLNRTDVVMLSLLCLDFSPLEMSLFLDKSIGATYTARSRLFEKLGVKSIDELKEKLKLV